MRRAPVVFALVQFFLLPLSSVAQDPNSLGDIARRQRQSGDQVAHPQVIDTGGYRTKVPPLVLKPISPFQVFAWLGGGMPSDFLAREVRTRGVTFYADSEFVENAKKAGRTPISRVNWKRLRRRLHRRNWAIPKRLET
jgi:hypothetical protein